MGWKSKVLAGLLGLSFFGLGAWPLGLICFVYLAVSFRPGGASKKEKAGSRLRLRSRVTLAAFLLTLSVVALASGGSFSPMFFFAAGLAALLWPSLVRLLPIVELAPVGDSILLRSRYLPFQWCSIAELKPGAEPFPMAASSFSGTLLVFTDTGRTYCIVSCRAYERKEAEQKALAGLRAAPPSGRTGAYLLPLDAGAAADLLRMKLSPIRLPSEGLPQAVAGISGLLVLGCSHGKVNRASAYRIEGAAATPSLPGPPKELAVSPLTWEVFDSIGKRTRWPDPDRFSDLLDSMLATRGVPLAERVSQLEAAGDLLRVRSLSGDEVPTTRPQLRAIVSIYSDHG